MRRFTAISIGLAALLAVTCGCSKDKRESQKAAADAAWTRHYANIFAFQCLQTYYLWLDEIEEDLAGWMTDEEPISKVKSVRYKDASGKEIDRWTVLTDNISSLQDNVAGVSTTYGANMVLYYYDKEKTRVCMVVRYCSADSPAARAGLKRGDVITKINDEYIPAADWESIVYGRFLHASSCKLGLADGASVNLRAVEMYEDPVLLWKTFDCSGKKVGYLIYNRFTLDSCVKLIEACTALKAEGITELILDMRYNPGGYVYTENLFASMLAPRNEVDNRSVFETAVYNSKLSQSIQDKETRFADSFNFTSGGKKYSFSTKDANLGITKLYAILGTGSASASEALLVGLGPYLDIEIIGEQSSGKYCTGLLYPALSWFEDYKTGLKEQDYTNGRKYLSNWGIYVMYSRYADKDGNTACMPDGFKPDIPVEDAPMERWQLGDEHEAMLRTALERAGKTDLAPLEAPVQHRQAASLMTKGPELENPYGFAGMVLLPEQL